MGKALYREHRPRRLADVVGQEHITTALEKALKNTQTSHAYLFTGPRGVGKTSIARILAHEVNDLPYDDESNHLDIIEIDAASNRRIDEVRDLREKVHTAPASAKYKVYIIDEVHMLTKEAFNALLKTLEEPPAHVIFILATTELHKLPETIISRTQHFSFRPIGEQKVIDHLRSIAKREKVKIDDDALKLLAEHGGGSFRDSINMLDQIRAYGDAKIASADVEQMLGVAPEQAIDQLVNAITELEANHVVESLQTLSNQGVEPAMLAKQVSANIRNRLLYKSWSDRDAGLQLLERLIQVPASVNPKAYLEVILLESVFSADSSKEAGSARPIPKTNSATKKHRETENKQPPPEIGAQEETAKEAEQPSEEQKQKAASKISTSAGPSVVDAAIWSQVLGHIKTRYNTLYGVLRMAQPQFEGDTVTLAFKFAFHQKRINDAKNKKVITDAIMQLCGTSVRLVCTVGDIAQKAEKADAITPKKDGEDKSLSAISNIFGGAELLES